jgi:hypothetical protein
VRSLVEVEEEMLAVVEVEAVSIGCGCCKRLALLLLVLLTVGGGGGGGADFLILFLIAAEAAAASDEELEEVVRGVTILGIFVFFLQRGVRFVSLPPAERALFLEILSFFEKERLSIFSIKNCGRDELRTHTNNTTPQCLNQVTKRLPTARMILL